MGINPYLVGGRNGRPQHRPSPIWPHWTNTIRRGKRLKTCLTRPNKSAYLSRKVSPCPRVKAIRKRSVMIKLFHSIVFLALLFLAWTLPASSEPFSPFCESAVEKLHKARQFLIPSQRAMELARATERLAYAELAVCTRGGIFNVAKAYACNEASWKAPQRTKEVILAEDEYLQGRKEFVERFEYARETCLGDP